MTEGPGRPTRASGGPHGRPPDPQDAEPLGGGRPLNVVPLGGQPLHQRVRPEVPAHDEPGLAVVAQQSQPGEQHVVQRRLADAYRRIGPDEVHVRARSLQLGRQGRGLGGVDIGVPGRGGIAGGEVDGALVNCIWSLRGNKYRYQLC